MQEFQERNWFKESVPITDEEDSLCRCRDWCLENYDLSTWDDVPVAVNEVEAEAPPETATPAPASTPEPITDTQPDELAFEKEEPKTETEAGIKAEAEEKIDDLSDTANVVDATTTATQDMTLEIPDIPDVPEKMEIPEAVEMPEEPTTSDAPAVADMSIQVQLPTCTRCAQQKPVWKEEEPVGTDYEPIDIDNLASYEKEILHM